MHGPPAATGAAPRGMSHPNQEIKSGWLLKKAESSWGWRKRWFALYPGRLTYQVCPSPSSPPARTPSRRSHVHTPCTAKRPSALSTLGALPCAPRRPSLFRLALYTPGALTYQLCHSVTWPAPYDTAVRPRPQAPSPPPLPAVPP